MSHTGIEYARGDDGKPGYGWNFYVGCRHQEEGLCPLKGKCWAESMWKRQVGAAVKKGIVLSDFHHPHLIPERLLFPLSIKKPSRFLVNFMGDLFGDWVEPEAEIGQTIEYTNGKVGQGYRFYYDAPLKRVVFEVARICPQHTFIFLTKNPQNYQKWGEFPDNCWLGASATDAMSFYESVAWLSKGKAKIKFISFEPLLESINGGECEGKRLDMLHAVQWAIIGQQTPASPKTTPQISWIKEIVEAADKADCAVFLKNNLGELLDTDRTIYPMSHRYIRNAIGGGEWKLRQEFPKV